MEQAPPKCTYTDSRRINWFFRHQVDFPIARVGRTRAVRASSKRWIPPHLANIQNVQYVIDISDEVGLDSKNILETRRKRNARNLKTWTAGPTVSSPIPKEALGVAAMLITGTMTHLAELTLYFPETTKGFSMTV